MELLKRFHQESDKDDGAFYRYMRLIMIMGEQAQKAGTEQARRAEAEARQAEAELWSLLRASSERKTKNLRTITGKVQLMKAFDVLLEIPGLSKGFRLSTWHKIECLKIDEYVIHYVEDLKNTWNKLLNYKPSSLLKVGPNDVQALQGKSPGSCKAHASSIGRLLSSGQIFVNFKVHKQDRIWNQILSASQDILIPSFATFFDDVNYLLEPAMYVRSLISSKLTKHGTIYQALEKCHNPNQGTVSIQRSEYENVQKKGSSKEQLDFGIRTIWLTAMRNCFNTTPKSLLIKRKYKNDLLVGPKNGIDVETALFRVASCASYQGFNSIEIERLRNRSSMTNGRSPLDCGYNTASLRIADLKLSGRPRISQYKDEVPNLFLEILHDGQHIRIDQPSAFFIRRSVYLAFFGRLDVEGFLATGAGKGTGIQAESSQPPRASSPSHEHDLHENEANDQEIGNGCAQRVSEEPRDLSPFSSSDIPVIGPGKSAPNKDVITTRQILHSPSASSEYGLENGVDTTKPVQWTTREMDSQIRLLNRGPTKSGPRERKGSDHPQDPKTNHLGQKSRYTQLLLTGLQNSVGLSTKTDLVSLDQAIEKKERDLEMKPQTSHSNLTLKSVLGKREAPDQQSLEPTKRRREDTYTQLLLNHQENVGPSPETGLVTSAPSVRDLHFTSPRISPRKQKQAIEQEQGMEKEQKIDDGPVRRPYKGPLISVLGKRGAYKPPSPFASGEEHDVGNRYTQLIVPPIQSLQSTNKRKRTVGEDIGGPAKSPRLRNDTKPKTKSARNGGQHRNFWTLRDDSKYSVSFLKNENQGWVVVNELNNASEFEIIQVAIKMTANLERCSLYNRKGTLVLPRECINQETNNGIIEIYVCEPGKYENLEARETPRR